MILLQVDAWTGFATWVQAGTGLIALIVSFFTYFQSKQIKELSQIVVELEKQTKTLASRYELELLTSITHRMPYFISFEFTTENIYHQLTIKNVGLEADILKFFVPEEILFLGIYPFKDHRPETRLFYINFEFEPAHKNSHFSFQIYFADRVHNFFSQRVNVAPAEKSAIIMPPEQVKEFAMGSLSLGDAPFRVVVF